MGLWKPVASSATRWLVFIETGVPITQGSLDFIKKHSNGRLQNFRELSCLKVVIVDKEREMNHVT